MYGGMGKHGRGGSGGGRGVKRSLPPPAPSGQLQRIGASSANGARLSLGSSGPSPSRCGEAIAAAVPEENFRMISAESLDFGAIIRLTPDLVDEIRRIEAQGGAARIKFDANSNNLSGNVLEVGGKEFKFTWSRELGVCDIYEELQNGEDSNGLLSECGTAWRKLNVQRILDESLKNHVKMRSEEAERQHKSRKSIVLDPANPSVKNQAKTLAAAALEGNMKRMHWKKDQFKKRKVDSVPSAVPQKPVFKSGTPSNFSGNLPSTSPQPSPPDHVGITAPTSSFGTSTKPPRAEEHAIIASSEENMNSEREMPNRSSHGPTPRKPVASKGVAASQPSDLRSLLITLLMANPKGMSLKALEKSVGEAIPNAGKKMESIIKSIATYQAPGRYLLKPGIDLDVSRKPPSRTMSPDLQSGRASASEERERENVQEVDHKAQLPDLADSDNENLDIEKIDIENIDIEKNSPEISAVDVKPNDEKEQGACTSSGSGSDSDSESDSSDSESDSQSQSKSKSQSSDSESGESTSSKEGSDVDVDIMTSDDDKDQIGDKALTTSKPVFEENADIVQKPSPSDPHYQLMGINSFVAEDTEKKSKDARMKGSRDSFEEQKQLDHVGPTTVDQKLLGKDRPNVERISKDRNKRVSDPKHFQERPGSSKRPWAASSGNPKSQEKSMSNAVDFNEDGLDSRRSSDKYTQEVNASKQSVKSKDKMNKDIRDVIMDVNEKYSAEEERGLFYVDQRESQKDSKVVPPLRRELSELELGEFREPKVSASKVNVMDNFSLESKKGRTPGKASAESKRESPYLSKCASQPSQQVNARRIHESESTAISSQLHQRAASCSLVQTDTKQNGFHVPPKASLDSKSNTANGLRVSSDRSKESFRVESVTSSGQRVDFSSDEDDSFYAKYDKLEPVPRGPIKDFSQYREYIQEYREKYDCYSSLNTHLEKYRNEFLKLGRELEINKGRDKDAYRAISEQIMQMYQRCRKKHTRMKKIFVVLHDELKVLKQRIKDFVEEHSRN